MRETSATGTPSARDCIAEMIRLLIRGAGFTLARDNDGVGYEVVDARQPGHLTVKALGFTEVPDNDESQPPYARVSSMHQVWSTVVGRACISAGRWRSDVHIVHLKDGRILIRVPDLDTAQFLLDFVRAYYASSVTGIRNFAATYRP